MSHKRVCFITREDRNYPLHSQATLNAWLKFAMEDFNRSGYYKPCFWFVGRDSGDWAVFVRASVDEHDTSFVWWFWRRGWGITGAANVEDREAMVDAWDSVIKEGMTPQGWMECGFMWDAA